MPVAPPEASFTTIMDFDLGFAFQFTLPGLMDRHKLNPYGVTTSLVIYFSSSYFAFITLPYGD